MYKRIFSFKRSVVELFFIPKPLYEFYWEIYRGWNVWSLFTFFWIVLFSIGSEWRGERYII